MVLIIWSDEMCAYIRTDFNEHLLCDLIVFSYYLATVLSNYYPWFDILKLYVKWKITGRQKQQITNDWANYTLAFQSNCCFISLPASVHLSVRLSVCLSVLKRYLVRKTILQRFELESPNLHQTCMLGQSRQVLKMGVADLRGHLGVSKSGVGLSVNWYMTLYDQFLYSSS